MRNERGNINGPNGQSGSLEFLTVTGDYTITEVNAGQVIEVTAAATITLGADLPAAGFYCHVDRVGAGAVVFAQGAGATIQSTGGNAPTITAQYGGATVTKGRGAGVWKVQGGVS